MLWRQNPQRVAWLVVTINFVVCCLLAVGVPLGLRSFLRSATRPMQSYITATAGTVQLFPPDAVDPVAVTERRAIPEGSRFVTDANARALLTVLADGPDSPILATLQLYQDTDLRLNVARAPRFPWNHSANQLVLDLRKGRVSVSAQIVQDRPIDVQMRTPHASVAFGSGTYDIALESDATQVRTRAGTAQVLAAGRQVTANSGERISVAAGRPPDLPVPAALNLVLNGELEGRLSPPWQEAIKVGAGLVAGTITQQSIDQRQVVRFSRKTEDGAHNEVGLKQEINRDVQGYDSMSLRLDVKLLYQSVPGGGYLASEYPVMVDMAYTDIYGKDLHWYQGFYYMDLPSESTWAPPNGEKTPQDIWYTYESLNLFDLLRDTRPSRINSIMIYASGHDFDSMVSDVALSVR